MSQSISKQCPKCLTPSVMEAEKCAKCGHVYRTQFPPAQQRKEQNGSIVDDPNIAVVQTSKLKTAHLSSTTQATRYLCAAAHLDSIFRNRVIRYLLYEHNRSTGGSFGVDLATVLDHCLIARRRQTNREIMLTIIAAAMMATVFWRVRHFPSMGLDEILNWLADPTVSHSILSGLLIAWIVVMFEMWQGRYRVAVALFARKAYSPDDIQHKASEKATEKLRRIVEEEDRNVLIYNGFSPFVGAGYDIGGWSFALNLKKGTELLGKHDTPDEFQVGELFSYIEKNVHDMQMAEVTVTENVFANGMFIRDDIDFLPDPLARPSHRLDTNVMEQLKNSPTEGMRYCQCIQVNVAEGEMMFSTFLRFWKVGTNLFTEVNYFVLPPVKKAYRVVDAISPCPTTLETWLRKLGFLSLTLVATPCLILLSPLALLVKALTPLYQWMTRQINSVLIREIPQYNYGAKTSIRQLAASDRYDHYFQKQDVQMYQKLVERQILDSMIEFLDAHHIDTTDMKDREKTILNEGLIMAGGSIAAKNIAIGKRSTVKETKFARLIKTVKS